MIKTILSYLLPNGVRWIDVEFTEIGIQTSYDDIPNLFHHSMFWL